MAKHKHPPRLSEAQLQIMNVVWDREEATVAEVWEALSADRQLARNTVQTMMTRLEQKGWLTHRTAGQTFHYAAAVARGATLRRLVRDLVDSAFGGSVEGLVLALLEDRDISQEEAELIRAMIDEAKGSES